MRRSSNNNSALTPAGSWNRWDDRANSSPDREEQHNGRATVPWPPRLRSEDDGGRNSPWRSFEERVRTGPFGLSRFPSQPHSPVRILIVDTDVDPALRRFIQDSPPRIRGEWQLLGPEAEPEDPGLTEEEFKKAMKKLKRHIHNPTYPRKRAWKRGLFSSRSTVAGNSKADADADADGEDDKEEGKNCAICLEAFEANEQVMKTPCNHMFHNDCIVPWVKSRGQCPVCRFALCERTQQRRPRETALVPRTISSNSNSNGYYYGNGSGAAGGIWDDELYYLIRAMEEAFNWVNYSR